MYLPLIFIDIFLFSACKGQCKFFKVFEFILIIIDGELECISVCARAYLQIPLFL